MTPLTRSAHPQHRHWLVRSTWLFGVALIGLALANPVAAQEAEADAEDQATANRPLTSVRIQQLIKEAVAPIQAEAEELGKIAKTEDLEHRPVFRRPHQSVTNLSTDMIPDVAKRMLRPFTGNDYKDLYIRWHLLDLLKQARPSQRKEIRDELIRLVQDMPAALKRSEEPERTREPEDLWREYWQLMNRCRVVIGYPPFTERVDPPASFKHMSGEKRSAAEAAYKRALEIRPQLKTIVNEGAVAYNRRVRRVNFIIRQYRGELIYELLKTGDPKVLDIVHRAIDKHINNRSGVGFDLLSFAYLALFDGVLEMYPASDLKQFGAKLERTGRSHEKYVKYEREPRNFADYAFHMVYTLRDAEAITDLRVDRGEDNKS